MERTGRRIRRQRRRSLRKWRRDPAAAGAVIGRRSSGMPRRSARAPARRRGGMGSERAGEILPLVFALISVCNKMPNFFITFAFRVMPLYVCILP